MAGEVARTICHVDEKAMDIEHAKKVSQQVSKVSDFIILNISSHSLQMLLLWDFDLKKKSLKQAVYSQK